MIGLLQRVSQASVSIDGETVATIGRGILVLAAVEQNDGPQQARRLAQRLLSYRMFSDDSGRMNHNVCQIGGDLLIVPQFTLAADTQRGNRPGFSNAAEPDHGQLMFDHMVAVVRESYQRVQTGRFGEDMDVCLVNQGPVTFWLRVPPAESAT